MENNINILIDFARENNIANEIIEKAIEYIQEEKLNIDNNFRGNKTRRISTIKNWANCYDRNHRELIDLDKLTSSQRLHLSRCMNRVSAIGNSTDEIHVCELY